MSKNPLYLFKGNACYPNTMYSENFTSVYSPCTFPSLNNSSSLISGKKTIVIGQQLFGIDSG